MSTSQFLKNIVNVFDGGVASSKVMKPSISRQVVQRVLHRNKNPYRTPYPRYMSYMPMDISPPYQTVAVAKSKKTRKSKNKSKSAKKSKKTKKTTKPRTNTEDDLVDMLSKINVSNDRNKQLSHVGRQLLAEAAKVAKEERKRQLLAPYSGQPRRSARSRSQPERFLP
jgi:hypothetical protein